MCCEYYWSGEQWWLRLGVGIGDDRGQQFHFRSSPREGDFCRFITGGQLGFALKMDLAGKGPVLVDKIIREDDGDFTVLGNGIGSDFFAVVVTAVDNYRSVDERYRLGSGM